MWILPSEKKYVRLRFTVIPRIPKKLTFLEGAWKAGKFVMTHEKKISFAGLVLSK